MRIGMDANQLVLVQGVRDTRATLLRWNLAPWPVLRPWVIGASAIAAALLLAVGVIGSIVTPDAPPALLPGLTAPAGLGDVGHVLYRNSLVLALHAMACVAGFMAGSSMPPPASKRTGLSGWGPGKAGSLGIGFVAWGPPFPPSPQAYVIGGGAASIAAQIGTSPGTLLLTLLPHAIPELFALFLPLAAWMIASRRGEWHDLLAATFVTVAISVPILLAAAAVETWVAPHLLAAVATN